MTKTKPNTSQIAVEKLTEAQAKAELKRLGPEIGGLSCPLRHGGGRLVGGATRRGRPGGEDFTAKRPTLADNPGELGRKRLPHIFELRGDVYMDHAAFLGPNERQKAAGRQI